MYFFLPLADKKITFWLAAAPLVYLKHQITQCLHKMEWIVSSVYFTLLLLTLASSFNGKWLNQSGNNVVKLKVKSSYLVLLLLGQSKDGLFLWSIINQWWWNNGDGIMYVNVCVCISDGNKYLAWNWSVSWSVLVGMLKNNLLFCDYFITTIQLQATTD